MKIYIQYLIVLILTLWCHYTSQGQNYVVGLQHNLSHVSPQYDFEGMIEYERDYIFESNFMNNIALYVHIPVSNNFNIQTRLGTFDMSYTSEIWYENNEFRFISITEYESIQQHYIGVYPGFLWEGNSLSFSINGGMDIYFIRSTVSENSLIKRPQGSPVVSHPRLSKARLGYQVHANLYIMMNSFAVTMGVGLRGTRLFMEQWYFTSHFLNITDLNIGIAYFIDRHKKDKVE